ncbi:hypothetical protein [Agromyces seonyuensis]|uniref:Uncharacterized protein n=1 Tax=Agromyces seonyuensis TaxID=2662446 RepID=A0A6I4P7A3_9MICO|nr:hypothetical protein [Agromyces seonyuensis]MWB99607.1 hypothetical protein [Agromyces seonyuensis]
MTSDAAGDEDEEAAERLTDAQRALRAQLLATEHWSLLASRSTTQGEVLTRIAIYLTLVSAGLVLLGILSQATGFSGWFGAAAVGILLVLVLLGFITLVRVYNTATEDLAYVLAMNRLRAAYLDLDPGIGRYLLMGTTEDQAGIDRTYHPFFPRPVSQVLGSSMMIITVVTAVVTGLFTGGLCAWLGLPVAAAVAAGIVAASVVIGLALRNGYVRYRRSLAALERLRND